MTIHPSTARLFYALWPDPATRDALAALQPAVRGRLVPVANLHLTLAFLGSQPRDSISLLGALMDKLPLQGFPLTIDRYGHFRKARIAWAGPSAMPDTLLWIYNALMNALAQAGVNVKSTGGFRPHVTLARVRKRLRAVHSFPGDRKHKFHIEAVWSSEPLRQPDLCELDDASASSADEDTDSKQPGITGINCAGYGSAVVVTASFGFVAAGHVLRALADRADRAQRAATEVGTDVGVDGPAQDKLREASGT